MAYPEQVGQGFNHQAKKVMTNVFEKKYSDFNDWLNKQPLSTDSVRSYSSRIKKLTQFLVQRPEKYNDLTTETKDEIAKDFKQYLQLVSNAKPATINAYILGLNKYFDFLAIGHTTEISEYVIARLPCSLSMLEQKALLKAIERTKRAKDQAIMMMFLYTGIRISECQKLATDDVFVIGPSARIVVRSRNGGAHREIPLNSSLCQVLQKWLTERSERYSGMSNAFFVNPQGRQLSAASIDGIIRKIGRECGLNISAEKIRNTMLINLMNTSHDLALVADIAGHRDLKTTARYKVHNAADKANAIEQLLSHN